MGPSVQVTLKHTWLGDLAITLVSPGGKILTLQLYAGFNEVTDGTGGVGDGSDLAFTYPILYSDAGTKAAELMGNSISGTQVACKDDAACHYTPSPGKGPGVKFSDFVGDPIKGNWQLCVADDSSGDLGNVDGATLTIQY